MNVSQWPGNIEISLIENQFVGASDRLSGDEATHTVPVCRDRMQEGNDFFQVCELCGIEIGDAIDHFCRVGHAGAFQNDHIRLIVPYQLGDSPGEIFLRIATDAAACKVHHLFGDGACAGAVDAHFAGFVHQHAGPFALALPMFKQPHQERGFSRAEGAAEDIKGDRGLVSRPMGLKCTSEIPA